MLLAVSSIVDTGARGTAARRSMRRADAISDASVHGLLTVNERTALFFHPLLRDLLIRRFKELTGETRARAPRQVPAICSTPTSGTRRSRSAELSLRRRASSRTRSTVALDDLLEAGPHKQPGAVGRSRRERRESKGGLIDYAEAELRLRQGDFDRSLALAACAGDALAGDLCSARPPSWPRRSAHLATRPRTAGQAPRRSQQDSATDTANARRSPLAALLVGRGRPSSPDAEQFALALSEANDGSHNHALRIATAKVYLGFNYGKLRERVDAAEECVALADTCG